jgi:hypothetical protein
MIMFEKVLFKKEKKIRVKNHQNDKSSSREE